MMHPPPVLIAGPTASGKSALALAVAEAVGGVIINADSMQVYGDLSIITARPTQADEARVPHRLYGHVPASEAYSVGRYLRDVAAALDAARAATMRPIIVGGTGLYFKALIEGLSPIPPIPEAVRSYWRSEAQRLGAVALHGVLAGRDFATAARLSTGDAQRVTRALEVLEATGRPLSCWQSQPGTPLIQQEDAVKIWLEVERDELYRRADARLALMLAGGAVEEVARLLDLGLSSELPAMRAVGVPPLSRLVRGQITREAAMEAARLDTRHYIKRQMTWGRRNMVSWKAYKSQLNYLNNQQIERILR